MVCLISTNILEVMNIEGLRGLLTLKEDRRIFLTTALE